MRLLSIFCNLTDTLITLLHYVDRNAVCAALCFIQNIFGEKLEVYKCKIEGALLLGRYSKLLI